MLSPHERHLLIAIGLVLLLGGIVKFCRSQSSVKVVPTKPLPTLDQVQEREPRGD